MRSGNRYCTSYVSASSFTLLTSHLSLNLLYFPWRMRNYELTVVLPVEVGTRQKKNLADLEKRIEGLGGKVVKSQDWGKRSLAYKIKKQDTGCYFFLEVNLPSDAVNQLSGQLEVDDDILRYLLVTGENQNTDAKSKKRVKKS